MDLSVFFQTKSQANDFSERLALLSEKTYETTFDLENTLMETLGIEKKDKMMILLRDNGISTQSQTALKGFFDKLREDMQKIPVLPLTIAFEPKTQTLKMLSDWFALTMQKQVIFDIVVDQKIIAGATITFQGKFGDYSIRQQFEKIVSDVLTKSN